MIPVPCIGCKYHKSRPIPFIGNVDGCINKRVDVLRYFKLSTNGGKCTERPVG